MIHNILSEAPSPGPTVLLVDDDRLILVTLSQGLRNAGFRTVEANSGEEALRIVESTSPNIAIIDYDMPGMSGLKIAEALQSAKAFPLIFLSAYDDEWIVHAAAEVGAMAYLVKPLDPLQLVPTIRTALRRFKDLNALQGESLQLNAALKSSRAISIVVGLLMERMQLCEKEAYDRLRQYCRSNNRKVTDVAAEILSTTDRLNSVLADIGRSLVPGGSREVGSAPKP